MITPYIHFQGNCRAAMERYCEVLGGELDIRNFSTMPDAPEAWVNSDRVLHATLKTPAHGTLFASDFPTDQDSDPQKAVSISISAPDPESARALYDAFSQDGDVIMPFAANFFSSGFGMVKDSFGTHWMISTESEMP